MKIIIKKLLKNIPAALVCFLLIQPQDSKAWDSTAAKFYPLKVGNVYVFHQISLWIQCNPFELRAKKRVTITDYVLKPNGKYYYKFTGWWLTGGQAKPWTYQRVDSNSMNVYAYDSLTNAEFLLDSLLIAQNNSFACKRFNVVTPHATCGSIYTQNIFGQNRTVKAFAASYIGGITAYYAIADGIGFVGYHSCELESGELFGLEGCILDGVVYGDTTLTDIQQLNNLQPNEIFLSQNYPNPFNPSTIINYELRIRNFVMLKVYDIAGREVASLVNEIMPAGKHAVEFNAADLPSGVYFYSLNVDGKQMGVKRMALVK